MSENLKIFSKTKSIDKSINNHHITKLIKIPRPLKNYNYPLKFNKTGKLIYLIKLKQFKQIIIKINYILFIIWKIKSILPKN